LGLNVRILPKQQLFIVSALICALAAPAIAAEKRHGLSAFGELKYPPDFKHFDYVNPDAPKGGRLVTLGVQAVLTFNSFNPFIRKNDPAQGLLEFMFDSLMVRAFDEPDAVYGLVAHSAEIADDKRSVTFFMRPEAKFRDGTPVTAEDVVYSFTVLRDVQRAKPQFAMLLQDVVKAEALDTHTVRYEFQGENLRDLPLTVAVMPILSKAWYEKAGFDKASLDPPMSSGIYEIAHFNQGTYIAYKRRPDYWGRDLPVMRGRYNFDEIRLD
jgi:microcin C transport system substrate-binding protein